MRLSLSIVTTIIIALVVWLIMLWQPPESWSDNAMSYEELLAQTFSGQRRAEPNSGMETAKNDAINGASFSRSSDVETPSDHRKNTLGIAGVNRRIALVDIGPLWLEFSENKHLERAISTDTFDVYAVFSKFNASYSVADVSIGYDLTALNDSVASTYMLPKGKLHTLLVPGHYQNIDIVGAWENIDYRRGLIAVIEKRHFNGDDETVSLQAIYQE